MRPIFLCLIALFIALHAAAQPRWEIQTPTPTGNTLTSMVFPSPRVGYAIGQRSVVVKTTDGGRSWRKIATDLPPGLALDRLQFVDSLHGWTYRNGDNQFFMTRNGGRTWARSLHDNFISAAEFTHPDTGWVCAIRSSEMRIEKTTDGGATWTLLTSPRLGVVSGLHFFPGDSVLAVHTSGAVAKSLDGGATWQTVSPPHVGVSLLAWVRFQDRWNGWAGWQDLYRTHDGGVSWQKVNLDSGHTMGYGPIQFTSPSHAWIAGPGEGQVWKTTDTGRTWTRLPAQGKGQTMLTIIDTAALALVTDGYVFHRSDDSGRTWRRTSAGHPDEQGYNMSFVSRNMGWKAGNGVYRTLNGGVTWTRMDTMTHSPGIQHVQFLNPRVGYATRLETPLGLASVALKTEDSGRTWRQIHRWGGLPWQVQFLDERVGFIAGGNFFFKTVDSGRTWLSLNVSPNARIALVQFVSPDTGFVVNAFGTFSVHRTTDGGATWPLSFGISSCTNCSLGGMDFKSSKLGFVAISNEVFRTRNGGQTWESVRRNTLRTFRDVSFADARNGLVVQDGDSSGWWRTRDGGDTWQFERLMDEPQVLNRVLFFDTLNAWTTAQERVFRFGYSRAGIEGGRFLAGQVYSRLDADCDRDSLEPGLRMGIIQVEPGPTFATMDSTGRYAAEVEPGLTYTVSQILPRNIGLIARQICPDSSYSVRFDSTAGDTIGSLDFADSLTRCPFLTVSAGLGRVRICEPGTIALRYCNEGFAPAQNVVLHARLPRYFHLVRADHPYTFDPVDSSYAFNLGTVQPGECGYVRIADSVACFVPVREAEACVRAWLTPGNPLEPRGCVPRPAGYDGSVIEVANTGCTGTWLEPVFTIRNTGEAMDGPREYRVYFDSLLAYRHPYRLGAGDSLAITVPRTAAQAQAGVSVRVEADQDAEYPYGRIASDRDRCWLTTPAPTRTREHFPPDDESPVVDVDCRPYRGSYDPNDKSVSPAGLGLEGAVAPQTRLTYTVLFQNTGNDTAYAVRIEDTLSADLDLATLELGAASHPYSFSVSGKGRPAFRFRFDNIKLVDSVANEPGSHGFVSFSIRPKAGLPVGSRIENTASIYFDFNNPVVTNRTVNTIYEPTVTPGLIDSVIVTRARPKLANCITVVPNPSTGIFTVSSEELLQAEVLSLQGQVLVPALAMKGRKEMDLRRYGKGVYLLRLRSEQGIEVRKLVVE